MNLPKMGKMVREIGRTTARTLGMFLGILLVSSCVPFGLLPERSGPIWLDEPVLARGLSEQGEPIDATILFRTSDSRIYCSVKMQGPDGVRLGARWYYGDKVIYDRVLDLGTKRRATWWLEVSPGQRFPVGHYRVEIYLLKEAVKVEDFQVIE